MTDRRNGAETGAARTYQLQLEQLEDRNLLTASPNIVLIVTDDQRFDSLDYMPLTRELFTGGTHFENAFVTTPVCCPSRTSILTGEYARHHGVRTNNGGGKKFDESETLATWLDAEGYVTFFAGKYLNGYNSSRVPPGWDDWHAFKHNTITLNSGYYRYTLNNNGTMQKYGKGEENYSTDVLRDHAVHFVSQIAEANDDAPFFLAFYPRAPHGKPTPARRHRGVPVDIKAYPSYNEKDVSDKPSLVRRLGSWTPAKQANRQRFFQNQVRTLMAVDEAVAAIYAAVAAAGELNQTLFVYTSDNGFMWGEHRLVNKALPYEESIRVPLLVRQGWADTVPVLQQMVLNIDLAPTILDYAGVAIPESVDGRSFRPLLEGSTTEWRTEFLIEAWDPKWVGIRGVDFVYVVWASGDKEYYDLTEDPFQMNNLIKNKAYKDQIAAAKERLAAFQAELG